MTDQGRNTINNTKKTITVLLLRHGEREDEASILSMSIEEQKRYALLPREVRSSNSFDPNITYVGYQQAHVAFMNIIKAIQDRHRVDTTVHPKVNVVCSPMRRCIGTALMLSSAIVSSSSPSSSSSMSHREESVDDCIGLDWWSFFHQNHHSDVNDNNNGNISTSSTEPTPILVMNGLSTCAAAISKLGGTVQHVIQSGYTIPCAFLRNTTLSNQSFTNEIQSMIQDAFPQDHTDYDGSIIKSSNTITTELSMNISTILSTIQYFGHTILDIYVQNHDDMDLKEGIQPTLSTHKRISYYPLSAGTTTYDSTNNDHTIRTDVQYSTPERPKLKKNLYLPTPVEQADTSHTPTASSNRRVDTPNDDKSQSQHLLSLSSSITISNETFCDMLDDTQFDDETFIGALNRAVLLSVATTTDASSERTHKHEHPKNMNTLIDRVDDDDDHTYLIVVTHREGIRSLVDICYKNLNPKQYPPKRIKTPYCCIGTFTATIETKKHKETNIIKDTTNIQYKFHNVTPYEKFTSISLP